MWWVPLAEFFGRFALKFGVSFLEKKYPGFKDILNQIIGWLEDHNEDGTAKAAIQALSDHVDKLI